MFRLETKNWSQLASMPLILVNGLADLGLLACGLVNGFDALYLLACPWLVCFTGLGLLVFYFAKIVMRLILVLTCSHLFW